MRKLLLVACCLALQACALFDPAKQQACGSNVYLEQGVTLIDCAGAHSAVKNAEEATGISLAGTEILFARGTGWDADLARFGHSDAWGETQYGQVVVLAETPGVLVHEAYHVRDGQGNHCHWSDPARLAVFEAALSPGSFHDDCANVQCSSSHTYADGVGQIWGYGWVCK